ncbi:MAG: right-handed parallel beta-helix repeat-containing protein [Fibrobacterota bacterium]
MSGFNKKLVFSFFLLILIIVSSGSAADVSAKKPAGKKGTKINSGILSGRLTKELGPYLITGNVIVPAGKVLTIERGVNIFVGGKYTSIIVYGKIDARGTKNEPIAFRSAGKNPKPWDWDRIYLRSPTTSIFENVKISHSNYGIYAENSDVIIKESVFFRNSICGFFSRNATAKIEKSVFGPGMVTAVYLDSLSETYMDSCVVEDNINGIACGNFAKAEVKRSVVRKNKRGISYTYLSDLQLVDTKVSYNDVGALVQKLPGNGGIYNVNKNNILDVKNGAPEEFASVFKTPEPIRTLDLKNEITVDEDKFTPGVSAKKGKRIYLDIIGEMQLGGKYTMVDNFNEDVAAYNFDAVDTTEFDAEEQSDTADVYTPKYNEGFEPQLKLFLNSSKGGLDASFTADFYTNSHLSGEESSLPGIGKNKLNMNAATDIASLTLFDYNYDRSEFSVSAVDIFGVRYGGKFMEDADGTRRLTVKAGAGESVIPYQVGDPLEMDTVAQYSASHQEILGVVEADYRVNSKLNIGGFAVFSKDLKEPLVRNTGWVPDSQLAEGNISSKTGGFSAEYFLSQNTVLNTEIAAAIADSIDYGNAKISKESYTRIGENASITQKGAFKAGISSYYMKHNTSVTIKKVQPHYFTGGNPYLTTDMFAMELKLIRENILEKNSHSILGYALDAKYEIDDYSYRNMTDLSAIADNYDDGDREEDPSHDLYVKLESEYEKEIDNDNSFKIAPYISLRRSSQDIIDSDTSLAVKGKNEISFNLGGKYNLLKNYSALLSYKVTPVFDISSYSGYKVNGKAKDDYMKHYVKLGASGRWSRLYGSMSYYLSTKDRPYNSEKSISHKVSPRARITIMERKLYLTVDGSYYLQNKDYLDDSGEGSVSDISEQQKNYEAGGELKYNISSKLSLKAFGSYDRSYDLQGINGSSLSPKDGSSDNYSAKYGGASVIFLF